MAVKMVRLTRFTQGLPIVDNAGRAVSSFITVLNAALKQIETAFNGIIDAQNSANAAQMSADSAATNASSANDAAAAAQATANTAKTSALAAQTTANNALTVANTKIDQTTADGRYVRQSQTVTWAVPTGTGSRTAYAEYVPPTISTVPTQAEVQAVADALGDLSRHMVALISDLQAINVLKH